MGSEQIQENQLLGEIYAQALEARGVTVERRFGIGARETYYPVLLDGSVDVVAEYSGNLLHLRRDAQQPIPTRCTTRCAAHCHRSSRC